MFPEYSQYLDYVESPEARAAFRLLVDSALRSTRFSPRPAPHGYMKNVTLFEGEKKPYSITFAKKWISFYIRNPGQTHPGLTLANLQEWFADATHGQAPEFKIKISTVEEARRILSLIGLEVALADSAPPHPEEIPEGLELREGAVKTVLVNAYERSPEARRRCIAHYGARCSVCGMSFEEVYGRLGAGYIHVHHIVDLATVGQEYVVDPVHDLRPVCANCHAMLHTQRPALSIEDLKRGLTLARADPLRQAS
jgi:HNH endonuclease